MVCIYCQNKTQVSNSRLQKRNNSIWRRRVCTVCDQIFTTIERADLQSSLTIKSPKGLQPLDRDRLLISIFESCKHRPRALQEASDLTNTVVGNVLQHSSPDGIIEQDALDAIIIAVLERFDTASATIYAAYRK